LRDERIHANPLTTVLERILFEVNQRVRCCKGGDYRVLGFGQINGEDGAQLKRIDPENISDIWHGDFWLPLSGLRATNFQCDFDAMDEREFNAFLIDKRLM
jgi:hypothetical protein